MLPSSAKEVQPATGAADTVLLCHHWIRPLHVNNCLVQLSYQIWPQKTTEGSPDCWANHWYNPPHSPRTVLIKRVKGLAKSLWTPHIQHTPSLNCCRLVDATELWAPERPDTGTGTVSFPKQSISWTLDIKRGTHNTYIIYSLHILIYLFFISILHISDLYTHNCLYYILCFCYFVHCLFVYYSFYYLCPVLLLSFCCTVELLCHYNKFLVCVNIPGQ